MDGVVATRRSMLLWAALALMPGCAKPYRVGEHVWVEWDEKNYPAYIIAVKGRTRYRVHYQGYESRWDEDVGVERIKGRIPPGVDVTPPPPPAKVARILGLKPKSDSKEPVSTHKAGDRVRVRWRGSVYTATIIEVHEKDRFLVHYEGFETAWDEVVQGERIVRRRQ